MFNKDFKCVSVCRVESKIFDTGCNMTLVRLFDIDKASGELKYLSINNEEKRIFDNRTMIYKTDGPQTEGYIGVWKWKAIPNDNDPEKDYVKSSFDDTIVPISIEKLEHDLDFEQLLDILKKGIRNKFCTRKVLFTFNENNRLYGLYCDLDEMKKEDNKYCIPENQMFARCIEINNSDILTHCDGYNYDVYRFYRYLNIDESKFDMRSIQNEKLLIKSLIQKHTVWASSKDYMSKQEWQRYKDALENLPYQNICEEYANIVECTFDEATERIGKYIDNVEEYFDGKDLSTEIVKSVIARDETLIEKCKDLVRTQYKETFEKENSELQKEINEKETELKKVENNIQDKNNELLKVSADLDSLSAIGDDFVESISEKIEKAKENTSEFLANTLFISQITGSCVHDNRQKSDNNKKCLFQAGSCENVEITGTPLKNYTDFINKLCENLKYVGINEDYAENFAEYMYGAYIRKIPMLLAGPGGELIANAFSATRLGKTANVLDCSCDYDADITSYLPDGEVVIVKYPFSSSWTSRIPEIIYSKSCFFILVTPFAENVLLEPRSWMNYVVPIITDSFMDGINVGFEFRGSKIIPDFVEYNFGDFEKEKDSIEEKYKSLFSDLMIPQICSLRVRELLAIRSDIRKEILSSNDSSSHGKSDDILTSLIPCAYFSDSGEQLMKYFADMEKEKEVEDYMNFYFGRSNS